MISLNFFNISPDKIDVVYQGCNPGFNTDVSLIEKEISADEIPSSKILYTLCGDH